MGCWFPERGGRARARPGLPRRRRKSWRGATFLSFLLQEAATPRSSASSSSVRQAEHRGGRAASSVFSVFSKPRQRQARSDAVVELCPGGELGGCPSSRGGRDGGDVERDDGRRRRRRQVTSSSSVSVPVSAPRNAATQDPGHADRRQQQRSGGRRRPAPQGEGARGPGGRTELGRRAPSASPVARGRRRRRRCWAARGRRRGRGSPRGGRRRAGQRRRRGGRRSSSCSKEAERLLLLPRPPPASASAAAAEASRGSAQRASQGIGAAGAPGEERGGDARGVAVARTRERQAAAEGEEKAFLSPRPPPNSSSFSASSSSEAESSKGLLLRRHRFRRQQQR